MRVCRKDGNVSTSRHKSASILRSFGANKKKKRTACFCFTCDSARGIFLSENYTRVCFTNFGYVYRSKKVFLNEKSFLTRGTPRNPKQQEKKMSTFLTKLTRLLKIKKSFLFTTRVVIIITTTATTAKSVTFLLRNFLRLSFFRVAKLITNLCVCVCVT